MKAVHINKNKMIRSVAAFLLFFCMFFTGKGIGIALVNAEVSKGWGLSFGEPGSKPTGNETVEKMAENDAFYMSETDEKIIYLTFDCGYENGNTEPILDALKKHDAKGTFFVVGHFIQTAPQLVKRMIDEGHTVGNHTYTHPDMSSISDRESFANELNQVADGFKALCGKEISHYYRPPRGVYNENNLKMAKELGYKTFFWSLAYKDWDTDNQPETKEAIDILTKRIHPGAVVLLHNTSKTNGIIIDELLTEWENMGYKFGELNKFIAFN